MAPGQAYDTQIIWPWPSRAIARLQVNLFLRVMRRREDGFHDLASLFHVIDLGDGMTLTARGGGAQEDCLACNMTGVPTDASNLVIKVPPLPPPPFVPATRCPAGPPLDDRRVPAMWVREQEGWGQSLGCSDYRIHRRCWRRRCRCCRCRTS